MANYSKETRRFHKERVRQLLIADVKLSILSVQELLSKDKKQPLSLDKGYIASILRDVRREAIEKIEKHTVTELLVDVESQYQETRKQLWDIINGPIIRHTVITLPDPNHPEDVTKITKQIVTTRITNKERIEAMRLLKDATKEYINQMVIIGKAKGSENIDMSLLNGSTVVNNLTQINIQNATPEQIAKRERELDADIKSLERQIAKLQERPCDGEIEGRVGEEKERTNDAEILDEQPAISGNASNDDGVHREG